jgi:hypothetical protein
MRGIGNRESGIGKAVRGKIRRSGLRTAFAVAIPHSPFPATVRKSPCGIPDAPKGAK